MQFTNCAFNIAHITSFGNIPVSNFIFFSIHIPIFHRSTRPPAPPSLDHPQKQQTMTQNELTQMADSLDDSASFLSPSIGSKSRQREESPPRINLRNVPWARLIPCSELGNACVRIGAVAAAGLQGAAGGGDNSGVNSGNSPAGPNVDGGYCRNDATGLTLYPRDPLTAPAAAHQPDSNITPTKRNPPGRTFLGLHNLQPSDRFNEFTMGRSMKCDLIAKVQPKELPDGYEVNSEADRHRAAAAKKRDRNSDWVHSTISNKHCKIFCHLKSNGKGGGGGNMGGGGGAGRGHFAGIANQGEEMEVYIEDTSGNGTAINNTTVLRRGERRVLHTGDEICLINPDTMRKQSNAIGAEEQSRLVKHYSYIFVNLYQQRGQHTLALGGEFGVRGTVQASGGGGSNRRAVYNSGGKFPQQQPQQPPRPRLVQDHYDVRDHLGSGTCGEVRRAIHRRTGRETCLSGSSSTSSCLERRHSIRAGRLTMCSMRESHLTTIVVGTVCPMRPRTLSIVFW